jgi:hypothetical protein
MSTAKSAGDKLRRASGYCTSMRVRGRPAVTMGAFVAPQHAGTGCALRPHDDAGIVLAGVERAGPDAAAWPGRSCFQGADLANLCGRPWHDNDLSGRLVVISRRGNDARTTGETRPRVKSCRKEENDPCHAARLCTTLVSSPFENSSEFNSTFMRAGSFSRFWEWLPLRP